MLEVGRCHRYAIVKFRLVSICSEDNRQAHCCLLMVDQIKHWWVFNILKVIELTSTFHSDNVVVLAGL